jgi:carbonic anhydrase/acetyltransferase-like protein (isoleucine patch superfamily)
LSNKSKENELFTELNELRKSMKAEYNRVLPSNELLFDRWEKAKLLNCGENSSIYDSSVILGEVSIGKNVWVGPFTLLEGINGKLSIGDYCNISTGVQIVTHDTVENVLTSGRTPAATGDVSVGNNTYIGGHTIITKGVTIGHHCVIGANSLVNKDIPDYSIAFGTPVKVMGKVLIDENDQVTYEYYK